MQILHKKDGKLEIKSYESSSNKVTSDKAMYRCRQKYSYTDIYLTVTSNKKYP